MQPDLLEELERPMQGTVGVPQICLALIHTDAGPASHHDPVEKVVDPSILNASVRVRSLVGGDLVVCATPPSTFAKALEVLADSNTLTDRRMKDLRRDVTWVEDHRPRNQDGSVAAPLPCDPQALRPILKTLKYDRRKTGPKRLYNIKSSLTSIQRKTGWLAPRNPQVPITTTTWALVLGLMGDGNLSRPTMRRFAVFCEARSVIPEAVTIDHLDDYRTAISTTKAKDPEQTVKKIKFIWNLLARSHANFPGRELPSKRNPNTIRDNANGIPASFTEDLDLYLIKLRKPGPFAKGFKQPAADSTVHSRRGILALAPHRLVNNGWLAETFTSLSSILNPSAVEGILTDYWETNCNDGEWTLGAEATAQALMAAARQWGDLSVADLDRVIEICRQVRARHRGFTMKKLERLAQFDDPKVERRFLELPEFLWRKANGFAKKGKLKRAAETGKYAVAMAILFDKPLRVSDLSNLDLALDFAHNSKGKITGIKIAAGRASKRAPVVEGALSHQTLQMLDAFVPKFRPVLVHDEATALFPGKKGGHNKSGSMSTQIKRVIARELGLDVNSHFFRTYVGTIIMDEDPRATALLQRVLGHNHESTSKRFYAVQRGRATNRGYAELIERRRRRLKQS